MAAKPTIHAGTMADLAQVATRCEHLTPHRWAQSPISNTRTRALAKLGWVQMQRIKIVNDGPVHPETSQSIMNVRLTNAGRAALALSRTSP